MDTILDAAIQILLVDSPQRLTTTRVAKRAGVLIGTIYQYVPHKQAVLYALNERCLDALAATAESACRKQHGAPIEQMAEVFLL